MCFVLLLLLPWKMLESTFTKLFWKNPKKMFIYLSFFARAFGIIHLKSMRFFSSCHEPRLNATEKCQHKRWTFLDIVRLRSVYFQWVFFLVVCVRLSTQAKSFSIFHLLCSEFIHFLCAVSALLIRILNADVLRHTRTTWKGVKIGKLYQLNEHRKKKPEQKLFFWFWIFLRFCLVFFSSS